MLPGISRFRLLYFGLYQCTGTALRPLAGGFTAPAIPLTGTVRFLFCMSGGYGGCRSSPLFKIALNAAFIIDSGRRAFRHK
jgi:hypothetical protein